MCDIDRSGSERFHRVFWAIGQCVKSFQDNCRPFLTVDGTYLRGKYTGVMLIASTLDADNKLLPIAYAIVERENGHNWSWFLLMLRRHVLTKPGEANYCLETIMSDRFKGLKEAVKQCLPNTHHGYCIKHMENNLTGALNDDYIKACLWRAARTYRPNEFQDAITDMVKHRPGITTWFTDKEPKHWAFSKFPGRKFGQTTTSISESCNNVLRGARGKAVTSIVEHTRMLTSKWFNNRRVECQSWHCRLTTYAQEHIKKARDRSRQYVTVAASPWVYQVNSASYQDIVDLQKKTCSCGEYQDLGLPCAHAMAAIDTTSADYHCFVDDFFFAENYAKVYGEPIYPTLDRSQWPEATFEIPRILPPLWKRPAGRPRTKRIESFHVLDRKRKTCAKCGQKGHNKRKCRNPGVCLTEQPLPTAGTAPFLS